MRKLLPFKLPLSYLLAGTLCLATGIISTHWYYQGKLSEASEDIVAIKQNTKSCSTQLVSAEDTLRTCNKAHFLNGYCMHSLETCQADKEMLAEEARRLYLVVDDLLLTEEESDYTATHP